MRRVDPKVYTEEYYLTDCTGYDAYKKTYGEELEIRFLEIKDYLKVGRQDRVLDVGCGRGELIYYTARQGADSYGIDYSKSAVKLALKLRNKKPQSVRVKMNFQEMDAKNLSYPDSFFSVAVLTDVVEHLYDEELDQVFSEIKRVLKPNGKLIIHTAPNKWFNDYGYKYYAYPLSTVIISIWNFLARGKYPNILNPSKLRTDSHSIMHINEPTYFSLKGLFKKYKFDGKLYSSNITVKKPIISKKDTLINIFVFLHPASKYFPLNILFGSDFISVLKNIK